MAPKLKNTRDRNWTDDEVCIFAEVLADPDNVFAAGLEMLAFEMIKKYFDKSLQEFYTDGKNVSKVNLDTSVDKLRIKYRNLKTSWSKENNRIKKKTGKFSKKNQNGIP